MQTEHQPAEASTTLNDMPIKQVRSDGATIFIATSRTCTTASRVQTQIVHADGKRGVLLTILKSGNASTLDVVRADQGRMLPRIQPTLPPELKISCCSISRCSCERRSTAC